MKNEHVLAYYEHLGDERWKARYAAPSEIDRAELADAASVAFLKAETEAIRQSAARYDAFTEGDGRHF